MAILVVLPATGHPVGSGTSTLAKLIEAREEKASYQNAMESFIKQVTPAGLSAVEKESRTKAAVAATDFAKVQPQIEKIYAENFSEAEMAYLISFFNSSLGKKFIGFESKKSELFKSFYMNQFAVVRKIMMNKK